jgi:hypothetical protein
LFDAETKRVVGQLHGGSAACHNKGWDVYGKLSFSFDKAEKEARLKDFFDPDNKVRSNQTDTDAQGVRSMDGREL